MTQTTCTACLLAADCPDCASWAAFAHVARTPTAPCPNHDPDPSLRQHNHLTGDTDHDR